MVDFVEHLKNVLPAAHVRDVNQFRERGQETELIENITVRCRSNDEEFASFGWSAFE